MSLCSKHITSWEYLTVQLSRMSEDDAGDPDLYGMFYGGSSVRIFSCPSCLFVCVSSCNLNPFPEGHCSCLRLRSLQVTSDFGHAGKDS